MPLFLASGSPRRRDLLTQHHVPFTVIPNGFNDDDYVFPGKDIAQEVEALATQKATQSNAPQDGFILGVDTVVVLNNQLFGKPKDKEQAITFLTQLSGKTHQVISGFCLYNTRTHTSETGHECTDVQFKVLSRAEIEEYVTHFEVLDKAGGYAIQDLQDRFILNVTGSIENVIGLPLKSLLPIFEKYGILGN